MQTINFSELKQILEYCPQTGNFYWKISRGRAVKGSRAGRKDGTGYRLIGYRGKYYLEHRLAWLYTYGEWPTKDLDHINRVKDDNRIENIRLATRSQNMINRGIHKNNKSGVTGILWDKRKNKWRPMISINGKVKWLGYFVDIEDAISARNKATKEYYGEYCPI